MRHRIIQLIVLFLTCVFTGCMNADKKPRHPNVILILADDQGWGDLSITGNPNLSTPNIDQMARNGVYFDRFFVQPVCSPTRAEILTGRYAARGGVYDTSSGGERLNLDEKTLAEYFKEAGYATAAYGKWHNGMQYPYHPNGRGFDDFYGFCSGHWGDYFSPMLEHNGAIVKGDGFIIDDLTNHGERFIEQNKDQPFFLYLPYNTPHGPMSVPDEWWDKIKDKPLDSLHRDPEKEEPEFTRAALALCENIDWNVGRILKKLEELALEENTIIIYLSDNGPNSWRWNGGMKGRKGSTDEGGVRSPLIMQWKGTIPPDKRVAQTGSSIDLVSTLSDLAGLKIAPPNPLDGISLAPLIMEEDPPWENRIIFNHWTDRVSARDERFRLDHLDSLYDMQNDPGQYTEVSADYPEIYEQLMKAKNNFEENVVVELKTTESRPFPVGHPDYPLTQLPARDAGFTGAIQRSNRWPNCSYLTNWTGLSDQISWDVEVLESGTFEVEIYYTCASKNTGSDVSLVFKNDTLPFKIAEAHDPPLVGMEFDRVERTNSYVKDFKPLHIGSIYLEKGPGQLLLKANSIPGNEVMDFRLMMLKKAS